MYIKNPILAQKDENLYFIGSHDDVSPLQKKLFNNFPFSATSRKALSTDSTARPETPIQR